MSDISMWKPSLFERAKHTAAFLSSQSSIQPKMALILGSGLGALADELTEATAISYENIEGFPVSGVEGHAGQLVFGKLEGTPVVIMQGRSHYYEGWDLEDITFPIRVFALMKIPYLLVTNSAGGVNLDYKPGDLMVINDQINLTGVNPLRGANDDRFGTRFPDMSDAYSTELTQVIHKAAKQLDIELKDGVYAGVAGPSYETPAEVRMLRILGGDAVGMSTVPEIIVANHSGMVAAGISCITNLAAGVGTEKLHHEEVKETANQVREKFSALVKKFVELMEL